MGDVVNRSINTVGISRSERQDGRQRTLLGANVVVGLEGITSDEFGVGIGLRIEGKKFKRCTIDHTSSIYSHQDNAEAMWK